MTPLEVATLLAVIASFDQRTVGESDVIAWREVAIEQRWTLALARRAVIQHHGVEDERIKPSHITRRIEAARKAVVAALPQDDLAPPQELANDPRAEIAWLRDRRDELTSIGLAQWADGRRVAPRLALTRAE